MMERERNESDIDSWIGDARNCHDDRPPQLPALGSKQIRELNINVRARNTQGKNHQHRDRWTESRPEDEVDNRARKRHQPDGKRYPTSYEKSERPSGCAHELV